MSTGICKSRDSRYWRALYNAALSEIGNSKLPQRIAEAEKAVVLRARELFQAADDNGEEKEDCEERNISSPDHKWVVKAKFLAQLAAPKEFV